MAKRTRPSLWTSHALRRAVDALTRSTPRAGPPAPRHATRPVSVKRQKTSGTGEWIAGLAAGPAGMRGYRLFKPHGLAFGERVPLVVMLHGCGQDAATFASSTRMNRIAARERFLVLYPEQDRRANVQGCWNWYATRSGQAHGEAATLMAAIGQICLLYPVDANRVAVAGMSAGASMGALLATRYPSRFKAIVMHSGVPPGAADSSMSALGAMRGSRLPAAPMPATAWPPLLVIHGDADRVVSAVNGHAAARLWAEAAGARSGTSRRIRRGRRHEMLVTDFKTRGRTVATLCEIEKMGHAWSGGDAREPHGDAGGPDASRMVWAFAERQFRAAG